MSLAIAFKSSEGIVLAADSRVTLTLTKQQGEQVETVHSYYDNATKLFNVSGQKHIGAVTYGTGIILSQGVPRTVHSYLPEFESQLTKRGDDRLDVDIFASRLGNFFMRKWKEAKMPENSEPMTFLIGGYNENIPFGKLYQVSVPASSDPSEYYSSPGDFGIAFGGQMNTVQRLLNGFDSNLMNSARGILNLDNSQAETLEKGLKQQLGQEIHYHVLPLQDSVNLAILLVRTTIEFQNLALGMRGVGGSIDVATITPVTGFEFVQRKVLTGEQSSY